MTRWHAVNGVMALVNAAYATISVTVMDYTGLFAWSAGIFSLAFITLSLAIAVFSPGGESA